MSFMDFFKKKMVEETKVETKNGVVDEIKKEEKKSFDGVVPENNDKLDMVIAFDTTDSMAAYIESVRKKVSE
jgi:hypothetical protein